MNRVVIRLLPDKSGRVRIHWFETLPEGPIETAQNVHLTAIGPVKIGGARGRIACAPQQKELIGKTKIGYQPTVHSDDPRAVTCPECLATASCQKALADLADILDNQDAATIMQLRAHAEARKG